MDERPGAEVDQLNALGTLTEPNRRALYDFVASAGTWVGRDEAAGAVGPRRGITAHHLDRLADEGLLEVDYRRLTGRGGPGAGRPAKVYRRARQDFGVTLPFRAYEFAGRLLSDAVAESQATGSDVSVTVDAAAGTAGRELGRAMNDRLGERRDADAVRTAVLGVLRDEGFEPSEQPDEAITLRNCPFHGLAQRHTELICGMNLTLIEAALGELDSNVFDPTLQPDPDTCCVRLVPREPSAPGA